MSRRLLEAAALIILIASLSGILNAQSTRKGFWVESAGGIGTIRVSCTDCPSVTKSDAVGGFLRVGGAISRHVLIGLESSTFTAGQFENVNPAKNWNANVIILWFPWKSGFFMKGGTGLAKSTVKLGSGADAVIVSGTGVGLTFGAGWDVPITHHFAISGNAGTWITATGDIELPMRVVDDPITSVYVLMIGLTYR
ncbi:MAG: hypothetical protein KDC45_08170 [Bacteroidetes bacterium]|nr:hypothetical protein [Bacteroidota bacterium]